MDVFHHHLVHNGGVPRSWPGFCATFDVAAAVFVAMLMLARARREPGRQGLSLR
jgi:hypothetical protein